MFARLQSPGCASGWEWGTGVGRQSGARPHFSSFYRRADQGKGIFPRVYRSEVTEVECGFKVYPQGPGTANSSLGVLRNGDRRLIGAVLLTGSTRHLVTLCRPFASSFVGLLLESPVLSSCNLFLTFFSPQL